MQLTDDSEIRFNKLNSEFLDSTNRQQKLGELIEDSMLFEINNKSGKIKLGPQMVIKAYENVYLDSSSKHYVPNTEECSMFNYVDAFSSLITEDSKDIVNRFEKNLLIYKMFTKEQ